MMEGFNLRPLSVEELERELQKNSAFPFTMVDPTIGTRKFSLKHHATEYVYSLFGLIASLAILAGSLVFAGVQSGMFVFSVAGVCITSCYVYVFADLKEYLLDERTLTYSFKLGDRWVTPLLLLFHALLLDSFNAESFTY